MEVRAFALVRVGGFESRNAWKKAFFREGKVCGIGDGERNGGPGIAWVCMRKDEPGGRCPNT